MKQSLSILTLILAIVAVLTAFYSPGQLQPAAAQMTVQEQDDPVSRSLTSREQEILQRQLKQSDGTIRRIMQRRAGVSQLPSSEEELRRGNALLEPILDEPYEFIFTPEFQAEYRRSPERAGKAFERLYGQTIDETIHAENERKRVIREHHIETIQELVGNNDARFNPITGMAQKRVGGPDGNSETWVDMHGPLAEIFNSELYEEATGLKRPVVPVDESRPTSEEIAIPTGSEQTEAETADKMTFEEFLEGVRESRTTSFGEQAGVAIGGAVGRIPGRLFEIAASLMTGQNKYGRYTTHASTAPAPQTLPEKIVHFLGLVATDVMVIAILAWGVVRCGRLFAKLRPGEMQQGGASAQQTAFQGAEVSKSVNKPSQTFMNHKQRRILITASVMLVVMLAFPPFHFASQSADINMGYGFILDPPKFGRFERPATVNVALLFMQWLVVSAVAGIAFMLAKSSEK